MRIYRKNCFINLLNTFLRQNNLLKTSTLFEQQINNLCEKANIRTKIDHILAIQNTKKNILNSQVITHALDLSVYNAIQLKIRLEFEASDNSQSK